jgi:hypothetical protein
LGRLIFPIFVWRQASPIRAFPYSNLMQQFPAYAIKVLELDFGQICSIRPGLLLQEGYASAFDAPLPIRLGCAERKSVV